MSEHSLDNNMEMDSVTKTIISNVEDILSIIELDLNIQVLDDLYQEGIYTEIFKKMFPFLQTKISLIENSSDSTAEKLQSLITCLQTDVLTMDLTHIKGQAIAEKDSRHLINFLQIILELSKLQDGLKAGTKEVSLILKYFGRTKQEEYDNNYSQYPPNQQDEQDHSNKQGRAQGEVNEQNDNEEEEDEEEEGIYREENEERVEQKMPQQPGIDFTFKNTRLTKKKSQSNLIQEEKKAIEDGLYAKPQPRVITSDPNFNAKPQYDEYGQQQNIIHQEEQQSEDQFIQKTFSDEQREDTEKIQELYNLFNNGLLVENDPRFQELNFLLQKYSLTLDILNQEFLNQNQQQPQDNGEDSTLAQVIKISQSRLEKMKNPINLVDSDTNIIIQEKQKKYQKFLKDYKRDYERKMRRKGEKNDYHNQQNEYKRQSIAEHEDKMLRKEYEDEQKSLYYQMRDKKVQYLRNIHKIIFELEKKKIIDEQNEYNENKKRMEEEAKNKLISIENKYRNRIIMLKEGLEQKRRERHTAELAQRQELSRQERELKERKRKQIEDLKDLWRVEREKFDLITKDDRKLENEILELYKKY